MATLRIDLRSGFDRDTAEIWIDRDLRWREDAVTTKFTLDLAASVPLEVPDGSADVRIVLPDRRIEGTPPARRASALGMSTAWSSGIVRRKRPCERSRHKNAVPCPVGRRSSSRVGVRSDRGRRCRRARAVLRR